MANIAARRMHPFHPKQLSDIEMQVVTCDLLIIGGGNAGCFVATEAAKLDPSLKVVIMEKAEIMRSGACSAGMDAINTYIPKGKTPEDLVRWSRAQVGGGPLREDLALSNAKELNESVEDLERWGLPILRDGDGNVRYRGKWDISIHGEQLKPIMGKRHSRAAPTCTTASRAPGCSCTGAAVSGRWASASATGNSTCSGRRLRSWPRAARARCTSPIRRTPRTVAPRYGCAPTAWDPGTPWASGRARS